MADIYQTLKALGAARSVAEVDQVMAQAGRQFTRDQLLSLAEAGHMRREQLRLDEKVLIQP